LKYSQRRKLPSCVEDSVRNAWPDPGGQYTGFKRKGDFECERPSKAPRIAEFVPQATRCPQCLRTPCLAIAKEAIITSAGGQSNKQRRHEAYNTFAQILKYGQRRKLPSCVEDAVRNAWPDPGGQYTGFKRKGD